MRDDLAAVPAGFMPEEVPKGVNLVEHGRALASKLRIGRSKFLAQQDVASEAEYKRRMVSEGRVMFHAQYGLPSLEDSVAGLRFIHSELSGRGARLDRFGICLRLSMGLPEDMRSERAAETGLRLADPEEWCELAQAVPIQPHFGDHMIGSPASVENTVRALRAGGTCIGNFSQYFAYDYPGWTDEVGRVSATIEALGIMAALKPQGAVVHSNLDDGPGGLFADRTSTVGWAYLERYIVEDLIGAQLVHCFGNMVTRPATRLAMLLAIDELHGRESAGSMIFANTMFGPDEDRNLATLATSVLVDTVGQLLRPTGHAVQSLPVSEHRRIPSPEEIVQAQMIGSQLAEEARHLAGLVDLRGANALKSRLLAGAAGFRDRVLGAFAAAGVDIGDPLALTLALRLVGPRKIEDLYGEGKPDPDLPYGRRPAVATEMFEYLAEATGAARYRVREAGLAGSAGRRCAVIASTDVHEFGKMVVAAALREAGVRVIDLGTTADPVSLAVEAGRQRTDAIAVSTLNGLALSFVERLLEECRKCGVASPVFVGGRLNQESGGPLPEDVVGRLGRAGVIAGNDYLAMIRQLCPEG